MIYFLYDLVVFVKKKIHINKYIKYVELLDYLS